MHSRRGFIRRVIAAGAMILLPATAWAKKIAIKLDKVPKLKEEGGWMITKIKEKQILFIRDTQDSVRALSPVCTHNKCLVAFNPNVKKIECGCHKSSFDLDGKNLGGPASKPLQAYPAKLSKDRIILSLD